MCVRVCVKRMFTLSWLWIGLDIMYLCSSVIDWWVDYVADLLPLLQTLSFSLPLEAGPPPSADSYDLRELGDPGGAWSIARGEVAER